MQVNRLARELSLLRAAHNASVVSTTSSASAGPSAEPADSHIMSGPSYPFPTPRHNRTPSNTSTRSQATAFSVSDTRRAPTLSRRNSLSRRSQTGSPGPQALHLADGSLNYLHQQRVPHAATPSSVAATPGSIGHAEQLSPGLMPATARYEETAYYRSELEMAKRENETLKRRIRELERLVRERRGDAGRGRSDSVSTTASVPVSGVGGGVVIAGPREGAPRDGAQREGRPSERDRAASVAGSVSVGVPEEEVKVGESAASAGLHRGAEE